MAYGYIRASEAIISITAFLLLILFYGQFVKKMRATCFALVLFGLFGYLNSSVKDDLNYQQHFSYAPQDNLHGFDCQVMEVSSTAKGKPKLIVRVNSLTDSTLHTQPTRGKLLVYVQDADSAAFTYGQRLYIAIDDRGWDRIAAPSNPHAFDYSSMMAKQQVHHQIFVQSGAILRLDGFKGSDIKLLAFSIREHCKEWLRAYLTDPSRNAVAAALLLGEKSWLPEDVQTRYRDTGATHVLAVSGLHTGIIAGTILWMMQFIGRHRWWQRMLKCLFALAILWLFVFITGMAPSVLRAATMFSFILIARLWLRRYINIYNIIALSAFLLIWHDPNIIYQVGFQLSYSALLGIIAFQDILYRSVFLPFTWMRVIWQLMTVSIAAQIGTLPFTVFYFHMLPLYSWLSGIIVVPLAGLILKAGMLLFITAATVPSIAIIPAYILDALIFVMNSGVALCHHLPGGTLSHLWLMPFEAVLLGLSILCMGVAFSIYQKNLLKVALGLCLVFTISFSVRQFSYRHQQVLTAYHVKGHTLIDIYDGYSCKCLTDADPDMPSVQFAVENNRLAHGVKECDIIPIQHAEDIDGSTPTYCLFDDAIMVTKISDRGIIIRSSDHKIETRVLTDGQFNYRQAIAIEETAADMGWVYFNTYRQGAYQHKLR